jgi:hypothetical protein
MLGLPNEFDIGGGRFGATVGVGVGESCAHTSCAAASCAQRITMILVGFMLSDLGWS